MGRPNSSDSRSGLVCIVLGILNHFRRFRQVRKVDQYLSKRRLVLIKKSTVFIRKSANVYQKVEQCFGGYERYTKLKVLANFQSYLSFQQLFLESSLAWMKSYLLFDQWPYLNSSADQISNLLKLTSIKSSQTRFTVKHLALIFKTIWLQNVDWHWRWNQPRDVATVSHLLQHPRTVRLQRRVHRSGLALPPKIWVTHLWL